MDDVVRKSWIFGGLLHFSAVRPGALTRSTGVTPFHFRFFASFCTFILAGRCLSDLLSFCRVFSPGRYELHRLPAPEDVDDYRCAVVLVYLQRKLSLTLREASPTEY